MVPLDELHAVVLESFKVVKKNDEISLDIDDSFDDYGLDSLDIMSVLLEIEKHLSIEFDEEFDLLEHDSVRKLYTFLSK